MAAPGCDGRLMQGRGEQQEACRAAAPHAAAGTSPVLTEPPPDLSEPGANSDRTTTCSVRTTPISDRSTPSSDGTTTSSVRTTASSGGTTGNSDGIPPASRSTTCPQTTAMHTRPPPLLAALPSCQAELPAAPSHLPQPLAPSVACMQSQSHACLWEPRLPEGC